MIGRKMIMRKEFRRRKRRSLTREFEKSMTIWTTVVWPPLAASISLVAWRDRGVWSLLVVCLKKRYSKQNTEK